MLQREIDGLRQAQAHQAKFGIEESALIHRADKPPAYMYHDDDTVARTVGQYLEKIEALNAENAGLKDQLQRQGPSSPTLGPQDQNTIAQLKEELKEAASGQKKLLDANSKLLEEVGRMQEYIKYIQSLNMSDLNQSNPFASSKLDDQILTDADTLHIVLSSQSGEDMYCKIKKGEKLSKLKTTYFQRQGVTDPGSVRLFYQGATISDDATPESLRMRDGDVIAVI